jgi:signal transduction histidine kinase
MSDALRRALGESQADRDLLASHLVLIQGMHDASDQALSLEDLCSRVATVFVAELGFEEVVAFVAEADGELAVAGRFSQTERFGGPRALLPEDVPLLAREVVAELALIRWGGGGVGPRRRLPGALQGSAVGLPIVARGRCLGALVGLDVTPRRWTLAAHRALEVVAKILGRIVGNAEARFAFDALHHDLEIALSTAGTRLARKDKSLREHAGRIHELSTSLASASRVRDTFLGLLSHELRTPVAAILGFSALLREGAAGPMNPEQTEMLKRVEVNGRHLGRLLEDMLFLTEAESAHIEPRFEPVEVGRIVEEVAGAVPRLQEPGGPDLEVSISGAAARTETDPRLLGRALFHLLEHVSTNSASRKVRIAVDQEAEAIRIGLHGEGTEAPAEAAPTPPAAPPPSTPTEAETHRTNAGLGLGLVRLCVALLGGRYTLAAKAGGTSAELWLPTHGSNPAEEATGESPSRRGSRTSAAEPSATATDARAAGPRRRGTNGSLAQRLLPKRAVRRD